MAWSRRKGTRRKILISTQARSTLLGDAAHPMAPFKAQGANQALLDAVSLARCLAATDLAHFLTASVAGSELLEDDGSLLDGTLVDLYLAEFTTALGRAVDADAFRRQFETAVVDKARFVFSYLWPRIDASPSELERGANIWNRNSYNKDIKAATWLVARTAHALDAIS